MLRAVSWPGIQHWKIATSTDNLGILTLGVQGKLDVLDMSSLHSINQTETRVVKTVSITSREILYDGGALKCVSESTYACIDTNKQQKYFRNKKGNHSMTNC